MAHDSSLPGRSYCYVPSRSCQGYKEDIYGDLHAGSALNNTCSSFKTLQPMKKFCSASDCTGTCVAPPKAFAAQSCVHQQKESDVIGCVVMV